MQDQDLTTLHHAVSEAAQAPKDESKAMGTYTFRIHKDALAKANEMCAAHGTTLAEYLRKCCELLPKDYTP